MKNHKIIKDLVYVIVSLLLVLVMLYSGLQILESTVLRPGQSEQEGFVTKTIERNGVAYFPRQDITTVLIMGIDQFGPVEASGSYMNKGDADLNVVLIFDERAKVCNILHLNRDTMLDVSMLGLGGKPAGTRFGQLALAHTYGTGLADSCENTVKTVSSFLYGIEIDYYLSMNMDVIPMVNDAVGGVTVTVTEDFSGVDPSIQMGEMTLWGEQALTFVRTRKGVGDQLNLSRIDRHKEYLDGLVSVLQTKREEDLSFVLSLYEQIQPYTVTNCSVNVLSGMLERYTDYTLGEVVSPEGENIRGEEYMEFYVDEEALDELILRLFYAPKQ